MEDRCFLAFDLGAETGRTMLGRISENRIVTQEITRFHNNPVRILDNLYWDVHRLYAEIKKGMLASLAETRVPAEGLAVDTWGVDFGLIAGDGSVLGLPYAYRDSRTRGAMEEFFRLMPKEEIYERTGIQFMPFNSLFQLYVLVRDEPSLLERAETLLFMPDLFSYLLSGERTSEYSIASTSQLLDPRRADWDEALLDALGVGRRIMPGLRPPGSFIGPLNSEVAKETGLKGTSVIATAGHDTAAAIAAVPAEGADWAYISSGTWSLMGVETAAPVINSRALAANFTNEAGVCGTTRFLKNIAGLWLVQQCRREWAKNADLSYEELVRLAAEAPPFRALIDPDWPAFLSPPSMPEAIRNFCLETGQIPPSSPGATVRCILESLALKYRATLNLLRRLLDQKIDRIHVIGGGARNELLCQFTAEATELPVVAGPSEATATGNIMVQALASGMVSSLAELRAIVRNSVVLKRFEPGGATGWEDALARFEEIVSG
ncbi:MAG: rhamnulokinase family protein [Acidobacteriota bacterium]